MGRFQAAATLASTAQVSSGPKKANAPSLHCSVNRAIPTSVSSFVSLHIIFSLCPGSKLESLLICSTAYEIAPDTIRPCLSRTKCVVRSAVRYPIVRFFTLCEQMMLSIKHPTNRCMLCHILAGNFVLRVTVPYWVKNTTC